MGLSFDGNGKYVGWSNLFDYSSLSTIKASEYLPMPKRKVYNKTDDGFNIDAFVVEIVGAPTAVDRINGYVKLITYLNENNITDINYTVQEGAGVLAQLRMHEFTKIPQSLTEEASKNFISSHIQNTIQNLRNMIGAYSPIDMEVFRSASEASPKGEQASKMTLLNPSTKLFMQYQNITGKNVIGIAANGEKASFMWHYYINDVIQKTNTDTKFFQILFNQVIDNYNRTSQIPYEHINIIRYITNSSYRKDVLENYSNITELQKPLKDLEPYIERVKSSLFSFKTTRLQGRNSGNIQPQEVNTLPDVNFEGVNPELMAQYGIKMSGDITVDLMISQILSAATDNAKELILAKVNAGNKLAKMYLFLVTLGFNINDIVKFMTSPVVSFIDAVTEANIFTGQDTSIPDAIKLARGDFKNYYQSFMSKRTLSKIGNLDDGSEIKKKLAAGITEGIKNVFTKGSTEFIEFENALNAIEEAKYILDSAIDNEVESVAKSNPSRSKEDIREEIINSIPQDIDEFENILEGANEFSYFGRILGFNQGLPTSKADLQEKVQFIQKILSDRESTAGVDGELLDVRKLFIDKAYRKEIKDRYEKVKKCINIFNIIDHIPQFNSIFKIFSAVMDIDHNISIKTRKFDTVYKELKEGQYRVGYMSEKYQTRLLKGIDDAIITKFINNSGIRIPYKAGVNILNDLRQVVPAREDSQIEFNSLSDVASFKYLFETYIIPLLKQGKYIDVQNGQNVEVEDKSLSTNKFIQSLIRGDDNGMPLYKCDLDMLTIENSQNSKVKFQSYLKGLQELQKIKINGMSLSDMFVLYNLIVNKNQYGSDKMTTLFDQFIQNTGSLSLIKEYLNYVGKLDYSGSEEELQVSIIDLLKRAAAVVNSEVGQKDPTIIVNTDSGPVLMIKSRGGYERFSEIIPKVSGETQDEFLARIYNHNSYYVLGGVYSETIDRQVQALRTITNQTLDILNQLLRQGVLTIQKIC